MKDVDIMGTSQRHRFNALFSDRANSPAEKNIATVVQWLLKNGLF